MNWCRILIVIYLMMLVSSRKWLEGDIRLVGGRRRYMGTVVILHKGRWGAVCDDKWDIKDAAVACRQLGYTFAVRTAVQSEFGPGRRHIWLSQVECSGKEERLDKCPYQLLKSDIKNKCPGKYRAAGAICSAATTTTTAKVTENIVPEVMTTGKAEEVLTLSSVIMTNNTENNKENISIEFIALRENNENTTAEPVNYYANVAADHTTEFQQNARTNPSETSPIVKSAESTLPTTTIEPVLSTRPNISPLTENDRHDVYSERELTGENKEHANSISEQTSTYGSPTSPFNLSLPCKIKNKEDNLDGCEVYFADEPLIQNIEIQLKGGRYEWEGHLQIKLNDGAWGTICSDRWTLREAMVACNELGQYGKAKQALMTSYFGGADLHKVVQNIQCVGRESSLASCNITWSDKGHTCSKKTAVAGVVCSHHLPDLIPSLRAIEDSIRLQDQPLYYLRCAMEENCLANSAYVIQNTSLTWRNSMRRLLRFSTVVHNRGLADFRPYLPRGQWEWHACHMHYHSMEIFAHYDILDEKGARLAEGSKASFCLEDTTCDNGVHPQFNCRGFADQGLSVNCSDNYMYDIDCQWIDISDIKPGDYTFLMEVNPTMMVAESNFDNNVVSCRLYYNGYFASVRNCQYESLLDYRERVNIPN